MSTTRSAVRPGSISIRARPSVYCWRARFRTHSSLKSPSGRWLGGASTIASAGADVDEPASLTDIACHLLVDSIWNHHHLAERPALLELGHGLAHTRERMDRVDHGPQLAAPNELLKAEQVVASPPVRAADVDLAHPYIAKIGDRVVAAGGAAGHQPAVRANASHRLRPRVCAGVVDHDIGAPAAGQLPYPSGVVAAGSDHALVGSQPAQAPGLSPAAGARDHPCPAVFAELHAGDPDPTAGSDHDERLARTQGGSGHQHATGGPVGDRQRCHLAQTIGVLQFDQVVGRYQDVLGQPAGSVLADRPGGHGGIDENWGSDPRARDARAQLRDPPGDVAAGGVRQLHGNSGRSAADEDIEVIQRARCYPDERLTSTRVWAFHGLDQEPLGPSVFADQCRGHRLGHRPPIALVSTLPSGREGPPRIRPASPSGLGLTRNAWDYEDRNEPATREDGHGNLRGADAPADHQRGLRDEIGGAAASPGL